MAAWPPFAPFVIGALLPFEPFVIGGIGTLTGPLLGASLLVVLKDVLSSHVGHWTLWLGMVFIGVAMFMPKGIIGALMQWQDRRAAIGTRRDDPNSAGNL